METQTSLTLLLVFCKGIDTFVSYLFIICRDYVLRISIDLMKENGFTLKRANSRRYSAETFIDTDNADDIALLANTSTQAESLLHCLEQAAGKIDLHVNVDKTEYMCFNKKKKKKRAISNGNSLKFVGMFIYLSSCVSSTESDTNIRLAKAWTAIDTLSIIWKSNLSDKIKQRWYQFCSMDAPHERWRSVLRKS